MQRWLAEIGRDWWMLHHKHRCICPWIMGTMHTSHCPIAIQPHSTHRSLGWGGCVTNAHAHYMSIWLPSHWKSWLSLPLAAHYKGSQCSVKQSNLGTCNFDHYSFISHKLMNEWIKKYFKQSHNMLINSNSLPITCQIGHISWWLCLNIRGLVWRCLFPV